MLRQICIDYSHFIDEETEFKREVSNRPHTGFLEDRVESSEFNTRGQAKLVTVINYQYLQETQKRESTGIHAGDLKTQGS